MPQMEDVFDQVPDLRFIVGYRGRVDMMVDAFEGDYEIEVTDKENMFTYYLGTDGMVCKCTYTISTQSADFNYTRYSNEDMEALFELMEGAETVGFIQELLVTIIVDKLVKK
jgi:hypothetical protein